MKISKKDALEWFEYFSALENKENLYSEFEEIIQAVFLQIESVIDIRNNKLINQIHNLKNLNNRSLYVGEDSKFSKGCYSCLCGDGLNSIRKTNQCNLNCKFCYYHGHLENQKKIPDDMWQIGRNMYHEKDIERLITIQEKPTGVSYAYLEPFFEIEKYYSVVKKFSQAEIHQHLYTNGTLVNEQSLKELGEAGLNEIRFNLGATNCSDEVIDKIKIAKKHIQYVGIETPMTQEFFKSFLEKKNEILESKVDFINCAELHVNENNIANYVGENMYICRSGYVSPIWSRDLTLKFMKIADDEKWDLVVHDCSNLTKFSRELNYGKKLNLWFGANYYGLEYDEIPYNAFIPILRDEEFKFLDEEELPQHVKLNSYLNS